MKNIAKSVLLLLVMGIILFALTGCGNKLVATKTEKDSTFGEYDAKYEITFKNKKADKVTYTMKFKDEDKAKKAESLMNAGAALSDEKINVTRKGKKVITKMEAKDFVGSDDESLTKEKIKENLEKEGYKVK